MGNGRSGTEAPVAIVQHGHQHLITDGYDNHEGIGEILEGFSAVLALHLRYRVPLNLHLSGTFVEAAAWHAPDFFGWVHALLDEELVEILGSAYAQPILTLFGGDHNRRQLAEELALLEAHLDVDPGAVHGFWMPERVWDTARVADLLTSPALPNGGYRYVLLDDRLWYDVEGGERAAFDASTVPGRGPGSRWSGAEPGSDGPAGGAVAAFDDGRHLRPVLVDGGGGLTAVPISGDLRYAVPPHGDEHWALVRDVLHRVGAAGPGHLGVYADDLEKSAAVGAWAPRPWRRERLAAYEELLRWLAGDDGAPGAVLIGRWLERHPPAETRRLAAGTFYELSTWGAGEDYRGWWDAPAYAPYRAHLERVERALASVQPATGNGPDPNGDRRSLGGGGCGEAPGGLVDLAWKQLMAAAYETAWHGLGGAPAEVAPWARATASHARSALVTVTAARWARRPGRLNVWCADVDDDGEEELVLANAAVFAVVSPRWGGRVVALYDLSIPGGRMVVGNPADDWNWQEELNRYMAVPANHPGACADDGFENDRWVVAMTTQQPGVAEAVLRNIEPGSALAGSRKSFRLRAGSCRLEVAYSLGLETERFAVTHGFSPDYLHLLRSGRRDLRPVVGRRSRGWRAGTASVWVSAPAGEPVVFEPGPPAAAGHVLKVRTTAYRPDFALEIAVGLPTVDEVDLTTGRAARRPEAATARSAR